MQEVYGDFWEYPAQIKLITTNGDVRINGLAVMGRGIAQQVASRVPEIARILGQRLEMQQRGLLPTDTFKPKIRFLVYDPRNPTTGYWAFPVKYNWREKASLELISHSVGALYEIATAGNHATFLLPRPGCGNGGLKWEEVKDICKVLPDNVYIIDRK